MYLLIFLATICYDDACHLKRFAENPVRSSLSAVATEIVGKNIVCDRFHFKNHVDAWCRVNCNPNNCEDLRVDIFVYYPTQKISN